MSTEVAPRRFGVTLKYQEKRQVNTRVVGISQTPDNLWDLGLIRAT